MGDVFGIMERIGPFEYRIQYLITGVQQVVAIDPDKLDIFSTTTIRDKQPLACPFLRFDKENLAMCTVHLTRPELCRMYLCEKCTKVKKWDTLMTPHKQKSVSVFFTITHSSCVE